MRAVIKAKSLKARFRFIVLEYNSTVDTKFDRLSKVQSTPLYYNSVSLKT